MLKYIILILKGGAMGMADVVPGVSGGTIAFISGIYEELINSIRSVNIEALKLLFSGQIAQLWRHINGKFLVPVFLGIAISILSLAQLMTFLLEHYPIQIWSFFFGLIIASSLLVAKSVDKWGVKTIISMAVGIAVAYWITVATPTQTPNDWWFVMLAGAVAICAMILPGISGAFILLLMGKYQYIMNSLVNFDLAVISLFMVGAGVGIISFSHVLSWLLKKYHNITISLLMGFMIGSLNKVWPWKEVVSTYTSSHGEVRPLIESNILPTNFEAITGNEAHIFIAIILCVAGFMLILGVERLGDKLTAKK